jgi:hypothetical protein
MKLVDEVLTIFQRPFRKTGHRLMAGRVERVVMIKKMKLALASSAIVAAMSAAPANALTFVLTDIGGVAGSPAAAGFQAAANFWSSIITNNVTIRLNIGFSNLGPGILGGTGSSYTTRTVSSVATQIAAGGTSALDAQIAASGLPVLSGTGAVNVITSGYVDVENKLGVDTTKQVFDTDGSFNNRVLGFTTANAKALGYDIVNTRDAEIQFSSAINFDFNPSDGISVGASDFIGVAIHEIGHALGFVSGVDDYDYVGCPSGPACAQFSTVNLNDDWWGSTLDLFRYGTNPVAGNSPQLNWAVGTESYFSINRGLTEYNGFGDFSNGDFNGSDGYQASHWKAPVVAPFCTGLIGIMNPYLCGGRNAIFTGMDAAALDAIGWNFISGVRDNPNYTFSTRQLGAGAVPESSTWMMMIAGFGFAGASMRRRARVTAVTYG